ncbi:hypothetical protein ABOZ73_07860 [Caulobacter sp. 73W]|uniref:Calcium-binding protein n=1 Tax=Caulobacter sp. 73W TaxID=3161137 RepID=A0AB39KYF9_9CAUL
MAVFNGGEGLDVHYGTNGADTINGNGGNDYLHGDDATPSYGQGGDDIINGGAGDDELTGDWGADILDGGPGDDILREGRSQTYNDGKIDRMIGGSGADWFMLSVAPDLRLGNPAPSIASRTSPRAKAIASSSSTSSRAARSPGADHWRTRTLRSP